LVRLQRTESKTFYREFKKSKGKKVTSPPLLKTQRSKGSTESSTVKGEIRLGASGSKKGVRQGGFVVRSFEARPSKTRPTDRTRPKKFACKKKFGEASEDKLKCGEEIGQPPGRGGEGLEKGPQELRLCSSQEAGAVSQPT